MKLKFNHRYYLYYMYITSIKLLRLRKSVRDHSLRVVVDRMSLTNHALEPMCNTWQVRLLPIPAQFALVGGSTKSAGTRHAYATKDDVASAHKVLVEISRIHHKLSLFFPNINSYTREIKRGKKFRLARFGQIAMGR